MNPFSKIAGIALLASLSLSAGATQLVANRDFQDATNAPWVETGASQIIGEWGGFGFTAPGNKYAYFSGYSNANDSLTQAINFGTETGVAILRFDYQTFSMDVPGNDILKIFVGDSQIATIDMAPFPHPGLSPIATKSYDLSAFLGTGIKQLSFRSTTNSTIPSAALVDNISIDVRPVPEPATLTALGCGLIALIRRRKTA